MHKILAVHWRQSSHADISVSQLISRRPAKAPPKCANKLSVQYKALSTPSECNALVLIIDNCRKSGIFGVLCGPRCLICTHFSRKNSTPELALIKFCFMV